MKRIVIEKIFVYTLGFLFCLITSLNQGNKALNIEHDYLNDIASTMRKYNYVQKECLVCDLEYAKSEDIIDFEYDINPEKLKIKKISAEFNLNYTNDLNNIYSLLNELFSDDVSTYNNEVQTLLNNYAKNGEEQMWQDLNNDRQLTLRIEKTSSIEKDYKLYYSIVVFNH